MLTDYHEMGSDDTYFFMPGIQSRVNPETPLRNQELTTDITAYHAEYLDRIGSLYFSEEGYDDFYIGKGSTFPDVQGTIGILFEQASSRALAGASQAAAEEESRGWASGRASDGAAQGAGESSSA